MKTHVEFLESLNACSDAITYAEQYPTLQAAWFSCGRPDWMLWLCERLPALDVTSQEWRLLDCDFAEDALQYIPPTEEVRDVCEGVIEVARRFALGDASEEELSAAANAVANAAANAAYVANAAAYVANAAYAAYAYAAAANAAYAYAYAAANAANANAASYAAAKNRHADMIRAAISWERVARAVKTLNTTNKGNRG